TETVEASTPAVVSVTDQTPEARYPSFKGIMAAKKKPVESWALADLDVTPDQVGLAAAWSSVSATQKRPPRTKGEIVTDDGEGGARLVEFLAAQKFV
ncbi:MAG TPA: electron transfer flavoprotein subunit beta, partial [Nocardioidaceae bacterium]|nr:electron transfer flavoprotein subunit beta [Nocardioidaceae bacterium]